MKSTLAALIAVLAFSLSLPPIGASRVEAAETDPVAAAVAPFFRAFKTELAALSPDGRHLAFDVNDERGVAVLVVDLADQSSRRFVVIGESDRRDGVVQMSWVSPTNLLLVTRGRTIGRIDLASGVIAPLLHARDLETFRPDPRLGPRRIPGGVTADMPADPNSMRIASMEGGGPIEVELDSPRLQALISGDLFGPQARRASPRALTSALMGRGPDGSGTVMVEVRSDIGLFDDGRIARTTLNVPSNVTVVESGGLPPDEAAVNPFSDGYASYDIVISPTPHVVLALDTETGKRSVIQERPSLRRVLNDQQGRPRVALEARGDQRRFLYRDAHSKRWVPLDELLPEGEPFKFTVTPETLLAPRSLPLGFDYEGRLLYVATNVGTDTFALRALDTSTWRATELEVAHKKCDLVEPTALWVDGVLIFDPHRQELVGVRYASAQRGALWFDDELAQLQAALTRQFAPLRCEILEWDAARTRFLLDVSGPGDPGGFHLYQREGHKLIAVAARAPWLGADRLNRAHEFDFTLPDGSRLNGTIILPREPRLQPPPVLVYFHDGPWLSDAPVFDRGAQALAELGFAVLQLNHRGSSGSGRAHLEAIKAGFDRTVLEDVKVVLDRAGSTLGINPRMAAAFGNGFGGYLAVRAVQLDPETFRCAVAINTPGDLEQWCAAARPRSFFDDVRRQFFSGDPGALRAASALAAAPTTTRPVLVVHASEDSEVPIGMGRRLHRALQQGNENSAFLELRGEGHAGWSRDATERLFAELGQFFNATIYRYAVEIGPPTIIQ